MVTTMIIARIVSLDKLIFIEKVNIGLAQSENGMVSSESKAREKLSKWLE